MLSAYHGTKRSYNREKAHKAEDMIEATKLLKKRLET